MRRRKPDGYDWLCLVVWCGSLAWPVYLLVHSLGALAELLRGVMR